MIERFGFKDPDLTTPDHDKILLWVNKNWILLPQKFGFFNDSFKSYNNCNYCQICCWDWQSGSCNLQTLIEEEKANLSKISEEMKSDYAAIKELGCFFKLIKKNSEVIIEHPIVDRDARTGKIFNIGFVDMCVNIPHSIKFGRFDMKEYLKIEEEGIVKDRKLLIEIKPKILSIGETLRQIQLYKSHESGIYILVTRTTGLKELFAEQKIYIFEYDDIYDYEDSNEKQEVGKLI